MSDVAYQNAIAKKERLLKELETVNEFLKQYQRFAGKVEAGDIPKRVGREQTINVPLFSDQASMTDRQRNSVPERFRPIIRQVLLHQNHPLSLGSLLKALEENHTPIPGENPAKNLGTVLWRLKDGFVNLSGYGYWPKDTPFRSGNFNYYPR